MPVAVGTLVAHDGLAVQRLRELQVTQVLSGKSQVIQAPGYAWMVVAENMALYFKGPFFGLFCKGPILFPAIHLCKIVEFI